MGKARGGMRRLVETEEGKTNPRSTEGADSLKKRAAVCGVEKRKSEDSVWVFFLGERIMGKCGTNPRSTGGVKESPAG